jgi:hypothetical protein
MYNTSSVVKSIKKITNRYSTTSLVVIPPLLRKNNIMTSSRLTTDARTVDRISLTKTDKNITTNKPPNVIV